MDIEDIQKQCEVLSNEQLLLVINNKRLYTEKIVRAAYDEIRKRGLSKDEVKQIEKVQARSSKIITGDIHQDILLFEKIAFFFLFIPRLHFLVLRDYRKKGYALKIRQAGYFNLLGAIFFFLDLSLGVHHISFVAGIIIWILSFVASYAFNEYYFKQKTIQRMAARTSNAEVEKPDQNFYP